MRADSSLVATLAAALRNARRAKRVSIAALAAQAGVSPRLISEFEQGKRPHVSLETASRLLHLMHVVVTVARAPSPVDADRARAERAAVRRQTWTGSQSTLAMHDDPRPPATAGARLAAVSGASALTVALQRASLDSSSHEPR
ncbi:helix-turn-helix domain-containing protein [Gemmatimonas sp.]|uniref:helix-turn-helix domain-containing protein n=1 Tax=Gemmatimonas sp. TaxID=1962908 RepID=UPI0035613230